MEWIMEMIPPPGSKMDDLNLPAELPVDSDYENSREPDFDDSSAYSIASTKYNFTWENGRLYHDYKSGHPFPYDERAQDNEQVLHAMMLCLLEDKYWISPIDGDRVKNALDIGSGMGLWAEGVADRYPNANVVGVDSAPATDSVIPNCRFELADVTEEWLFTQPGELFDLIHLRILFGSFKTDDLVPLYKECLQHMASGGWIEHIEFEIKTRCDDGTENPDSELERFAHRTLDMTATHGHNFNISDDTANCMREAGLTDVREIRFKIPLGWWSADPKYKEVGRFYERYFKTGLQGWCMQVYTKNMGFTPDQVNAACLKAFAEIDSRRCHYYYNLVISIGKKP